jgi:hypothetical protein
MKDRDAVAEPFPESARSLRGEGDLWHEHDRRPFLIERGGCSTQIDLRLAASRNAVQQKPLVPTRP